MSYNMNRSSRPESSQAFNVSIILEELGGFYIGMTDESWLNPMKGAVRKDEHLAAKRRLRGTVPHRAPVCLRWTRNCLTFGVANFATAERWSPLPSITLASGSACWSPLPSTDLNLASRRRRKGRSRRQLLSTLACCFVLSERPA